MSLFVSKNFFNLAFAVLVSTNSGSSAAESLFTLKANDPLRVAMQPVGVLRFYTGQPGKAPDGWQDCIAAVISENYLITSASCAKATKWPFPMKYRIAGAELRLGLNGWSTGPNGVSHNQDLDSTFKVKLQPVESTTPSSEFGFLEVIGNPASKFGMINLLHREVREGEPITVLSTQFWNYRTDCKIAAPDKANRYSFRCADNPTYLNWGGIMDDRDKFVFSQEGLALIGSGVHVAAGSSFLNLPISQKQFWEDQKFHCKVGAVVFPAKNDPAYDPMLRYDTRVPPVIWKENYVSEATCDDGDMTYFNGLLCASGDEGACAGVQLAQDTSGRWWRSKRLIGQQDTEEQASFSTEMGLGVFNYLIHTADRAAFEKWMAWIKANPRIYSPLPSYCTHKECVFKAIDCPIFVTVAAGFGKATDAALFCNPLDGIDIPSPDEVAREFERLVGRLADAGDRYESALRRLIDQVASAAGLPKIDALLPSIADARAVFESSLEAMRNAHEKMMGALIGEAAAEVAQELVLANSVVNGVASVKVRFDTKLGKLTWEKGSPKMSDSSIATSMDAKYNPEGEFISGVELFLLRSLGYQSAILDEAANNMWERDKDNPFFEYLAHGRQPRPAPGRKSLTELMTEKCPSVDRPSFSRLQWFFERGEGIQEERKKTAWAESMYWDCLFLQNVSVADIHSKLSRNTASQSPFSIFGDAFRVGNKVKAQIEDAISNIEGKIHEIEEKLKHPPIISDFYAHNPCPNPPPLPPTPSDYCDHNPCPKW